MTTWQQKRFEKFRSCGQSLYVLPLPSLPSSLFLLFLFSSPLATRELSRWPTMVSPFHSFGKFPHETRSRRSEDPRADAAAAAAATSSKVLTIPKNSRTLASPAGSTSLRRWFALAKLHKYRRPNFFFPNRRCLFYTVEQPLSLDAGNHRVISLRISLFNRKESDPSRFEEIEMNRVILTV